MRGSPPAQSSLLGARALCSPWAGAANAFSVLAVRSCYALQESRIWPFPFSAVTALKQHHLHTGYPTPPTVLAGAGAAVVQFEGQGLGLGFWRPPHASRSCHSTARGGAGRRGLPWHCRVLQAVECTAALPKALVQGGLHCCPPPPLPRKSFACGSSTARPPAVSGAAPPGAKTRWGKSFPFAY